MKITMHGNPLTLVWGHRLKPEKRLRYFME